MTVSWNGAEVEKVDRVFGLDRIGHGVFELFNGKVCLLDYVVRDAEEGGRIALMLTGICSNFQLVAEF